MSNCNFMEQRVLDEADYVIENNATVRATATHFGVSKSTTHKDLTERLKDVAPTLVNSVKNVLNANKADRHLRGGMATKRKYSS